MSKKTPDDPYPTLVTLGHHCSDMERNAAQAERELIQLKLLHFLKKHIGETMEAVISRVFADGIHARCVKLPVDGFVPDHDASQRQVSIRTSRAHDQSGSKKATDFAWATKLTVKVAKVDLQDRQLYLEVVKNHTARNEPTSSRAKSSKPNYKAKRKKDRRDKKKLRKKKR